MSAHRNLPESPSGTFAGGVINRKERTWMTSEVKKLRLMWELGFTSGQIGEVLGRSRNSICSAARRYELPSRTPPIPHKPKPDLIRQRQEELGRLAAIEELMRAA